MLTAKQQIEIMEAVLRKRALQQVKETIDLMREIVTENPDIKIDLAQLAMGGLAYLESLPKQLEGNTQQ